MFLCRTSVNTKWRLVQTSNRAISISPCLEYKKVRGVKQVPMFDTREKRHANRPLDKIYYRDLIASQKKRRTWEYEIQPDQRATWKHRKWMDPYFKVWVNTIAEGYKDPKLSIHYKYRRACLQNADNVKELFSLFLDGYNSHKTVLPAFDHHFPQVNMSYFYQFLTHTKYVHGLPYALEHTQVDAEKFKAFVKFVENQTTFQLDENASVDNHKKRADVLKLIVNYLACVVGDEQTQLNYNAETSMFWTRGSGFVGRYLPDDISRCYQVHDDVIVQMTTDKPLPAYTSRNSKMSLSGEIPEYSEYTPEFYHLNGEGFSRNRISTGRRLAAGDLDLNYQAAFDEELLDQLSPPLYSSGRHGHTQVKMLPSDYSRELYNENLEHADITSEIEEHLKAYGIMGGWAWTASQAHFQGHFMDKDVEKPVCSQTVVFDENHLSVFCYQLNTVAIDKDNVPFHEYRNLCYGKTSVPLFNENNEFNKEALHLLYRVFSSKFTEASASEVSAYEESLLTQTVNPERFVFFLSWCR